MRLLTHNTMRNNSKEAKGKGFPLKITATEIRVDNSNNNNNNNNHHNCHNDTAQIAFVKSLLSSSRLDWSALVQACSEMGLSSTTAPAGGQQQLQLLLPPVLTDDMANNDDFLKALYSILMNVQLVQGMLTCPVTGREFPVTDGIPNMILDEDECEHVRF